MSYLYRKPTRGDYEDTYQLSNDDDDSICRIMIKDSTFNNFPNPQVFHDWLTNLDYYFDRYRFSEEGKVQLARRKLVGSARIYWDTVEGHCVRRRAPIENWDKIKDKLKKILS